MLQKDFSKKMCVQQVALVMRVACAVLLGAVCGWRALIVAQMMSPTSLVSVNHAGSGVGNGPSGAKAVTPDGRYVLFISNASDLLDESAKRGAVYVRDVVAGTTRMVDVNLAGTDRGNSFSSDDAWIGDDGRYVLFTSFASDLVANDTNGVSDVFLRDMVAGKTSLVSVNRAGTDSGRPGFIFFGSIAEGMSSDGRYILFTSYANDLVTNTPSTNIDQHLYLRDMVAGTTTLIDITRVGMPADNYIPGTRCDPGNPNCDVIGYDLEPVISANGRYVAFVSGARDLVSNNIGPLSLENVFVRDLQANTTALVSVNLSGQGSGFADRPSLSADGRYIIFRDGIRQLYVRDMALGVTSLVSINTAGTGGTGINDNYPVISADGTHVVFTSNSTTLTREKLDSTFDDVFVRDLVAGTTSLVSVNAWGTGGGNGQSFSARTSADGRFIVYLSRASDLVFNDKNGKNSSGSGCEDVFVRDVQLGVTTLISANAAGTASANGCSGFDYFVSADGRRVVFSSPASDIVPNDTNNASDVFIATVPTQFGQVQFSASSYQVNEGDGAAAITVTRTGGSEGAISVDYATSGGTASSRSSYTPAVGKLQFFPGEMSKTFQILITDDLIANGDKTVNLVLSNPSGGVTLGSQRTAILTIKDNDISTSGLNPLDDTRFFVRQHYLDFLNREPDSAGLQFWTNEIEQCNTDAKCREAKRINVSAAFYLSIEFQQSGFLVYRMYETAYRSAPTYSEFLADVQAIQQGVIVGAPGWDAQLESNKQMFANAFGDRASFKSIYEPKTIAEYYNALIANTGVTPSDALLNDFRDGKETRASLLRKMAEDPTFSAKQFNPAFVLMQYFGYLRRNPNDAPDSDFSGYNFWLGKLNQFGGNYIDAEMVKAFTSSSEYRQRFGP